MSKWGGSLQLLVNGMRICIVESISSCIERVCDTFDPDDHQVQILLVNNDHILWQGCNNDRNLFFVFVHPNIGLPTCMRGWRREGELD